MINICKLLYFLINNTLSTQTNREHFLSPFRISAQHEELCTRIKHASECYTKSAATSRVSPTSQISEQYSYVAERKCRRAACCRQETERKKREKETAARLYLYIRNIRGINIASQNRGAPRRIHRQSNCAPWRHN